jgi:hypothetical protein
MTKIGGSHSLFHNLAKQPCNISPGKARGALCRTTGCLEGSLHRNIWGEYWKKLLDYKKWVMLEYGKREADVCASQRKGICPDSCNGVMEAAQEKD